MAGFHCILKAEKCLYHIVYFNSLFGLFELEARGYLKWSEI